MMPKESNRGLAYDALNEHEKAILDYDKAFEINPRYAKAYIHRKPAYDVASEDDQTVSD
jgi:tetratricopeptide (TPR) repeat protein